MGILKEDSKKIGDGFGSIYMDLSEINVFLDGNVNSEFIIKLFDVNYYYSYLVKLFNNEINRLDILSREKGEVKLKFTKVELLELIKTTIEQGKIEVTEEIKNKLVFLMANASYEKLKKDKSDEEINIIADGQDLTYTYGEIFSFLELPEEEYKEFIRNNELLVYVAREALTKSGILSDYILPDYILNRITDIITYNAVDIEHINNINVTVDPYINEVILNEKFKNSILNTIPNEYDDLEKAIFVYIVLCQKLTYDEAFYAMNQSGRVAKIHEDIARIKSINYGNNTVVCYEVNAIYGKFLNELGINYVIEGNNYQDYAGHTYLKFKTGKFLVSADSVTSIIGGDLANAKIGTPLVGIKCLNMNDETRKEFDKKLYKVYKKIYGDFLLEYDRYLEEHKSDDILSKIRFIFNIMKTTNLSGIDKLSLFIHAYSKLLKNEKHNHTELTIVRRSQNENAEVAVVLTINLKEHVDDYDADNIYYIYDGNIVVMKTREELEVMINNRDIEFMNSGHNRIPGIEHLDFKI